jgi:hypothetical protein
MDGDSGRTVHMWIKDVYPVNNFWPVDNLWIVKNLGSYPQVIHCGRKATKEVIHSLST